MISASAVHPRRTPSVLPLAEYRALVALDDSFAPPAPAAPAERPQLVRAVLEYLLADGTAARLGVRPDGVPDGGDDAGMRRLLRSLLTVRGPEPLPDDVQHALDRLLQAERADRETSAAASLPRLPGRSDVALWRGDITTLGADAIVNAANAALPGCFHPFHACIDNAIHSAAGPRLREDCGRIMDLQGHPEPTGAAKATRGYHLPARFVLHTVGPIVPGALTVEHEAQLARSYRACLDLAAALHNVRSVAFCAISTGVFGFPKTPAARIALREVDAWLASRPGALDLVVFNVFSEEDRMVYEDVLGGRA